MRYRWTRLSKETSPSMSEYLTINQILPVGQRQPAGLNCSILKVGLPRHSTDSGTICQSASGLHAPVSASETLGAGLWGQ